MGTMEETPLTTRLAAVRPDFAGRVGLPIKHPEANKPIPADGGLAAGGQRLCSNLRQKMSDLVGTVLA